MRGIIEILVSFLYSDGSQEVWQMKQKDYHIYLDEQERWQIIQSLIDLKNALIAQGRYTDAVDDVLCVSVGRFSPFRVGLKTPISVNL